MGVLVGLNRRLLGSESVSLSESVSRIAIESVLGF